MNVLVTGGAGYIGSHACDALLNAGHEVTILDNLSRGHAKAVEILRGRGAGRVRFIAGDMGDTKVLDQAFAQPVDAVMHFAAFANVGESAVHPERYYQNNVGAMVPLVDALRRHRVSRIVYSSSCSVYGQPPDHLIPLQESAPLGPMSAYGRTKLIGEQLLQDHVGAARAEGREVALTCLRYFNVAGSEPAGELGEDHDPEMHLVPVVLRTAMGLQHRLKLFGDDYPTPDGTCVRDYVHVCDIASAHVRSLDAVLPGTTAMLNLGLGRGISNREIVEAARRVTGKPIEVDIAPRRPGDPARLFADTAQARSRLGWSPRFTELEQIIETAWKWLAAHPRGYRG
ncbi:MAG: UDP-glucose 4-epimerase GalE [Planctomycetes bacterium]|nr:UDP-glucose 4-epimerase GalE [Planctomycetota bacterium]